MGRALPVKYSKYFGAKRHESLKNENIRYDSLIGQEKAVGILIFSRSGKLFLVNFFLFKIYFHTITSVSIEKDQP